MTNIMWVSVGIHLFKVKIAIGRVNLPAGLADLLLVASQQKMQILTTALQFCSVKQAESAGPNPTDSNLKPP